MSKKFSEMKTDYYLKEKKKIEDYMKNHINTVTVKELREMCEDVFEQDDCIIEKYDGSSGFAMLVSDIVITYCIICSVRKIIPKSGYGT